MILQSFMNELYYILYRRRNASLTSAASSSIWLNHYSLTLTWSLTLVCSSFSEHRYSPTSASITIIYLCFFIRIIQKSNFTWFSLFLFYASKLLDASTNTNTMSQQAKLWVGECDDFCARARIFFGILLLCVAAWTLGSMFMHLHCNFYGAKCKAKIKFKRPYLKVN